MAQSIRPLAYYLFAGLQQRLQTALKLPNKPLISSVGQLRELVMNPGSLANPLQYPIAYLKLTNVNINDKGPRAQRLASRGIVTDRTLEGHDGNRVSFIPTLFTLELGLLTPDFDQMLDFLQRWTMASIKFRSNFALTYRGIDFEIIVNMNADISVPEKEDLMGTEKPDFYEMVGNLEMEGYMNNIDSLDDQEVPLIKFQLSNLNLVTTDSEALLVSTNGKVPIYGNPQNRIVPNLSKP